MLSHIAVEQHDQLLGECDHRLVRVVYGAALVEVVDRGAGALRVGAGSDLSVAFGPPPGGESRPALEHESIAFNTSSRGH